MVKHLEPRPNVLYKNYDLYPDKDSMPDASFYQELYKYKSVQDYLNYVKRKKRKKNKKKSQRRKKILKSLASVDFNNLDFAMDHYHYMPPFQDTGEYPISSANLTGGLADHVTPREDFGGKDIGISLNYGVEKDFPNKPSIRNKDIYIKLVDILSSTFHDLHTPEVDIVLMPAEYPINGMPDGIIPISDKDNIYNPSGYSPSNGYGVPDHAYTLTYSGVPFPDN